MDLQTKERENKTFLSSYREIGGIDGKPNDKKKIGFSMLQKSNQKAKFS